MVLTSIDRNFFTLQRGPVDIRPPVPIGNNCSQAPPLAVQIRSAYVGEEPAMNSIAHTGEDAHNGDDAVRATC